MCMCVNVLGLNPNANYVQVLAKLTNPCFLNQLVVMGTWWNLKETTG